MEVKYIKYILVLFLCFPFLHGECQDSAGYKSLLRVGAERTELYLAELQGKNVGIVANQTSMIGNTHLVDSLASLKINIKRVFAPEHGFRGEADAGEKIASGTDAKTGLSVVSLYGAHNKPTAKDLEGLDIVIYDIQDVGVRFYTYISTLQYVMEACAENNVSLIVFDRPNPNGFYIDGPVLEPECKSFVGMNPIPIVYALTAAEYAKMLNGERWLKDSVQCKLKVIPIENYSHKDYYELPVKPSPNLPNMTAVYLYPSLGWFEGTVVSVGRGTPTPFQIIGYPEFMKGLAKFTPISIPGAAKSPPYQNKVCRGIDLSGYSKDYFRNNGVIMLGLLAEMYSQSPHKKKFFNGYFNRLAGNTYLKQQVISCENHTKIRESWQPKLIVYKAIRKKYLLYADFE